MGGVRVDVNEELKFLGNSQLKKNQGGGGVGMVGSDGWVGLVGGGGQGGCERRIVVFVKIQFFFLFFIFFWGGGGVGGSGWWGVRVDVNAILGVGVMWGIGDVNQE